MSEDRRQETWWAEGDTPVHDDSRVTYLVDGRTAMLEMCLHYLKARKYIYLANWGMTAGLELVRGADHRAGPDGSHEQEALIAELRTQGLQEADIDFWCSHALSVQAVLGYAVSKGVEVRVLLWESLNLPGISYYDPEEACDQLTQVGVICLRDDSARGIMHHPIESLHQKISIVDGTHAFVGGVDPMVEHGDDFDRWDTPSHLFSTPLRRTSDGKTPHPWHDAHALIEGPAAGDVEFNFRERWNDLVERHHWDDNLLVPEHPLAPPLESKSLVQVSRTIPEHTYSFEPLIIRGIAQLYAHALNNARHFIYLENQYLWSPDIVDALIAAMNRNHAEPFRIVLVLPANAHDGKWDNDRHVEDLLEADNGRGIISVYSVYASGPGVGMDPFTDRPSYIHAKVGIIDDEWLTVGSANLNNRGMILNSQINAVIRDAALAREVRRSLWAEHLALPDEEVARTDPVKLIDSVWTDRVAETERIIAANHRPLTCAVHSYIVGRTLDTWRLGEADARHFDRSR